MAIPTGAAEVEDKTGGEGREDTPNFALDTSRLDRLLTLGRHTVLDDQTGSVDIKVEAVAEPEVVEETEAETPLTVAIDTLVISGLVVAALGLDITGTEIRNEIPETGFLVSADGVGNVPEDINVTGGETEFAFSVGHELITILDSSGKAEALESYTGTDRRGEPLADESISGEGELTVNTMSEEGVDTGATADEPVVCETVGLVGTANDIAVFVTVVVLLSVCADGEKETCRRNNSQNQTNTSHRYYKNLKIIRTHYLLNQVQI